MASESDLRVARGVVRSWGSRLPRSPAGTEIWESRLGFRGVETLVESIATALTAARAETWEKAIAAFNAEIARQAEFGMYPSQEDFIIALEAACRE